MHKLPAWLRARRRMATASATGLGLTLVLAACGGGGDSATPAPTPAPPPPPAPVPTVMAVDDPYTLPAGLAADLTVLSNDSATGGTATVSIATQPAHGKVTVQGNTLRYTPDAGFYGTDQFTYRADVGSANSTATVKLTVEAELILNGTVSPSPQATAEVLAQVGTQQFKGSADTSGAYSVRIKSSRPDDFVSLTSHETGTRSAIVLSSLVGGFDALFKAVADGKVDATAREALRLDTLSTARRGVLQQRGPLPDTAGKLRAALAQLNPRDVYESATLLQHVVDSAVALPAPIANLTELAANATASASLLTSWAPVNQGVPIALEAFLERSSIAQPFAPDSSTVRLAMHDGTLFTSDANSQHAVVDLRPDGTATIYLNASGAEMLTPQSARWSVNGAILKVTLDTMATIGLSPNLGPLNWDVALTALEIRQVRSADDSGRPSLSVRRQLSYLRKKIAGGNGLRSPGQDSWTPVTSFVVERDRLPLRAEDFAAGTRWAGLDLDDNPTQARCLCSPKTIEFTGGGLDALGFKGQLNAQGQWLLVSGTTTYRHTRLWQVDQGIEYWLVEVEQGGAVVNARVLPVARVKDFAGIPADGVARRWQLLSQPERASPTGDDRMQWALTADGKGVYSSRLYTNFFSTPGLAWTRAADGKSLAVATVTEGRPPNVPSLSLEIVGATRDGYLAVMQPYAGSARGWYGLVPGLVKLQDRALMP